MRETELVDMNLIDTDGNIRSEVNREAVEMIKKTAQIRIDKGLPPLINPINLEKSNGRYNLIDGKQRFVAMDESGAKRIEAFVGKNHPMKDWQSYDENKANADLSWIDYARFYKQKQEDGMTLRELENRTNEKKDSINRKIIALKVVDSCLGAETFDYYTVWEISKAPRRDWEILVRKAETHRQVAKLVKKSKVIRDMIDSVADADLREELRKELEPVIYEDYMTEDIARETILKKRGLWVGTPPIVRAMTRIRPFLNKYTKNFGENMEIKDWEEDGIVVYQFTVRYSKDLLEAEAYEE